MQKKLCRRKVEEMESGIDKSSNPPLKIIYPMLRLAMIFFCQLCLKAFCLIKVIQIKLTLMVFVWCMSLCPMVEFNLQNCAKVGL